MTSENIKKEIEIFQSAVKKLSNSIGRASSLWKDDKFSELSSSVREIASQSKEIIVMGDRCCSSIAKFEKITSEKY